MESLLTANVITISIIPSVTYTITSINTISGGLFIGISYQSGNSGSIPFTGGSSISFDFYEWTNESYPLIKNLNSFPGNSEGYSYGVFTAEIQKDLGNKFSFNINNLSNNKKVPLTSVQRTNYHTHLLIESNLSGNLADISTLKNEWNRTNDYYSVDNYLSDPAYTGLLSYVKINNLDYSLQENYNSNTPGSSGWIRVGSEINSLDLGESVVITGIVVDEPYVPAEPTAPSVGFG